MPVVCQVLFAATVTVRVVSCAVTAGIRTRASTVSASAAKPFVVTLTSQFFYPLFPTITVIGHNWTYATSNQAKDKRFKADAANLGQPPRHLSVV